MKYIREEPVLLDRDEIGKEMRAEASTSSICMEPGGTGAEAVGLADVQMLLGTGFAEQFGGYRFNRVLKEAVGKDRIVLARATGIVSLPNIQMQRAFVVVTPQAPRALLFRGGFGPHRYQSPVLGCVQRNRN